MTEVTHLAVAVTEVCEVTEVTHLAVTESGSDLRRWIGSSRRSGFGIS